MKKSLVAMVRCEDYDEALVYSAVEKGIKLLGGMGTFVKPGEKIVMKPNVLWGSDPEKCVTTHPAVFKAVGKLAQQAGAHLSYGDSPAFGTTSFHVQRAGLKAAAEELGIVLADFDHGKSVSHKTAVLNKKFTIANGVLEADGLVSLSKLKTHGLTRFTGAVKNQFGCIPGPLKGQFHAKMPDPNLFAAMLVDINTLIKPRLFIMDGIMAMEGNGPRNGKPRKLNVLLFSTDPVALDATACRIIDLNPEYVPTARAGEKAWLGSYHSENIELAGEELESFITRDFKVVRRPVTTFSSGRIRTFIKNQLTPRPVVDKSKCNACGTCIKMCPVGSEALRWKEEGGRKSPRHNYSKCIRCYCCQEICPEGAISINSTFLGRIINRGG
jgi:uncharacterized protein (DUF362 family)/ferredoxin-like protein FixX